MVAMVAMVAMVVIVMGHWRRHVNQALKDAPIMEISDFGWMGRRLLEQSRYTSFLASFLMGINSSSHSQQSTSLPMRARGRARGGRGY